MKKKKFCVGKMTERNCTQYICSYNGVKVWQNDAWFNMVNSVKSNFHLWSHNALFVWYFNITNWTYLTFWTRLYFMNFKNEVLHTTMDQCLSLTHGYFVIISLILRGLRQKNLCLGLQPSCAAPCYFSWYQFHCK